MSQPTQPLTQSELSQDIYEDFQSQPDSSLSQGFNEDNPSRPISGYNHPTYINNLDPKHQ
jgi:hypothetical protein